MEQIKVGDIVRVSEDAPEMYKGKGLNPLLTVLESKVIEIADGNALVQPDYTNGYASPFPIPTKYLVKVNVEPKERTIKVGDNVIVKHDANLSKLIGDFQTAVYVVKEINDGKATLCIDRMGFQNLGLMEVPLECIEKVDAIEYLHGRGRTVLCQDDMINKFDLSEYKVTCDAIRIALDKWAQYEADLAKEIAVKLAGSTNFRDAKEKAAYVVEYARKIVENLKKSEE